MMRRFRTKLLLPLLLLVLSIGSFIEFYWLPSWERQAVEARMTQEYDYLALLGDLLRSPLQSQDLATIYDLLDQLSVEKGHWDQLILVRDDGLQLYPLAETVPQQNGSLWIASEIEFEGQRLAELRVTLDLSSFLTAELSRLRTLELILLLVALLAVFLIGWMQKRLVLTPLDELSGVARKMAGGDFDQPISDQIRERGLEEFVDAFAVMRDSIAEKHRQLSFQVEERNVAERRLNDSQRVASLGCWEWRSENEVFWCSDSMRPIMRLDGLEALTRERFFARVHPADHATIDNRFERGLKAQESLEMEFRISGPGKVQYVHMIGQYDTTTGRYFGTCQDVTERRDIEASLRKLSSAITFSGSSVIITDIIGTIEYVNPKYTEATGFELSELLGQQPEVLSRNWMSSKKYEVLWNSILSGQNWRGELRSQCKDGSIFWSLVSISPIKNEFGELTHFVIVLEDVTELKNAHARMEQQALYDELTGLANRRLLFSRLRQRLERCESDLQMAGAVMLLDLDFFKAVNDTRGHQVGDELLKAVAGRLQDCLDEDELAARLGGDEFALLLNGGRDQHEVTRVADRVIAALSRPFLIDNAELQVTTSIGIALIPSDGRENDVLMKHADLAMYEAKEKGRNQYRFFTRGLHEQLQTYIRFSREMPDALARGEFSLNFQPQVDLRTGRITGAEALIRWHHPELGFVPPPAFITVAEETGFIVPLGRWVVEQACAALKQLKQAGYGDLSIAVNLSARQFRDPQLIDMITQVARDAEIDMTCLEIEITETLLMHDIEKAIETLQALRALGMSIAIDDFGIGYSSFVYLKTLPVDVLKVDREFIKDIPSHQDDMTITAAIISMAHHLNLKVVAEGIEYPVQQGFLENNHCDYGQGYLFGKPAPLAQFMALLPPALALEAHENVEAELD